MKAKMVVTTMLLAALLALSVAGTTLIAGAEANGGAGCNCEGWIVDIGDTTSEAQTGIQIAGWSSLVGGQDGSGTYGGVQNCRVMWEPGGGDQDKCATVTYTYSDGYTDPMCLEWSALDGQATDDGYEVYVDDTLVFTYTDQVTPETWYPQCVDLTQFDLPCQETHVVKFCATGVAWDNFGQWGQVAIDFVELGTESCCVDCEPPGNRELGLKVEVLELECICINISPSALNFGSLYPGGTSTQSFNVENCGTVTVDVTASTTSTFFGNNLQLEGSSWDSVSSWKLSGLAKDTDRDVNARVTVPAGYQAGTESGQLILWAEKSNN